MFLEKKPVLLAQLVRAPCLYRGCHRFKPCREYLSLVQTLKWNPSLSWRNWLARSTVNREAVSSILTESVFLAPLAQSVEHQTFNLRAAGSSPAGGSIGRFQQFNIIIYSKTTPTRNIGLGGRWSKAVDLRPTIFGCAGSNPARDNFFIL